MTSESPAASGAKRTPPKRARLTDDLIRRVAGMACASGRQFTVRDIELRGFTIRAGRTGFSFQLQYRRAGKQRLYVLTEGDFLEYENSGCAADAREAARRLKRQIERDPGFDPLAVKIAARRERRHGKTVADACSAWLAAHAAKRSFRCDKSMIRRHIVPRLGALPLATLTPERARDFYEAIRVGEGHAVAANRTIVLLHSIIRLAQPDAPNPARGIAELKRERRRRRVLTPAEMKALWQALDAARNQRIANVIRLLALTGARRGEVLRMEWSQLDLSAGVWARPAEMMKAGKADDMLLNRPAVEWLARMKADADPSEKFVFPGHDHGLARLRFVWERARREAGIPDVTIHDLRRTLASWAISNGVGMHVVSKMLAHANSKTTEDRYAHLSDSARRIGIESVGTLIRDAVAGDEAQQLEHEGKLQSVHRQGGN